MRCLLCRGAAQNGNICEPCFIGLPGNTNACQGCALPLPGQHQGRCAACIARPRPWDDAWAPLAYEFPVDTVVHALKFSRQLAAGRPLARAMATLPPPPVAELDACLIPVPLHFTRQWLRGFNQADELALHLGRATGLATNHTGLRRRRPTPAQAGLSARQRRRNLRGAFYWKGPRPPKAHALLVDDVMTTGSTLAECTRVLRAAGCKRVSVWVAARA